MSIHYSPTIWENDVTPVNETNMNHIEKGIEDAYEVINEIDGKIPEETSEENKLVNETQVNEALDAKADKVGPLPSYTGVKNSDLVIDFITNNNLNQKALILNNRYICTFIQIGPTHYIFEIESLNSSSRFFSGEGGTNLTGVTFGDILTTTTYRSDYELQSNKVTSLSNQSTDIEYPSAKCVHDALETKENLSNKVTSLSSESTDTQYPSAKLVYDKLALKADKVGPLPEFEVDRFTTKIKSFINTNSLSNKAVILRINNQPYLANIYLYGSQTRVTFELESIGIVPSLRFVGVYVEINDNTVFDSLMSDSYRGDYEVEKNKVTSLSGSSTDTEYPSAKLVYDQLALKEAVANKVSAFQGTPDNTHYPTEKLVYDNLQNVREVAEGKCKTYVLSYADTLQSIKDDITDNNVIIKDKEGNDITADFLNGNYDDYFGLDSEHIYANPSFNSQNASLSFGNPDYVTFVFRSIETEGDFYTYVLDIEYIDGNSFRAGDIFLVIESDVPNRWVGGKWLFYKT